MATNEIMTEEEFYKDFSKQLRELSLRLDRAKGSNALFRNDLKERCANIMYNAANVIDELWQKKSMADDGLYAVKDGMTYRMSVRTPEGKTIKMPKIRFTEAMRYDVPKEKE